MTTEKVKLPYGYLIFCYCGFEKPALARRRIIRGLTLNNFLFADFPGALAKLTVQGVQTQGLHAEYVCRLL